jgi:hypothetical protein
MDILYNMQINKWLIFTNKKIYATDHFQLFHNTF